jgi:uncharacterized surface protein with fasciclin (FAS1) repeats
MVMNAIFTLRKWVAPLLSVLLLLGVVTACQDEEIDMITTSDVNITEYLSLHPEQYSLYSEILKITKTEGFLATYGSYTSFVPTNSAIEAFLREQGKASLSEVQVNDLEDLVKFHLIRDTIPSTKFNDGKLRTATMFGQFIITGAQNNGGSTKRLINRQALLQQSDIRVGNGIIHVIDQVLQPSKRTLAEMIAANPEYSIFNEGLEATGLKEYLSILPQDQTDSAKMYHTVLVQSNAVFKAAGIDSYADLKARYSDTGNPQSASDSLYLFMAYHILPGLKYLPDIFTATSHTTLSPLDVVTSKLNGTTILINEDTFNGVTEPGAQIKREVSDNTAANGVLHVMDKHYAIKVRFPTAVYWEVSDIPEIRKLANYRKGNSPKYNPGDLEDINWGQGSLQYIVAPEARKFYVYHNDFMQFGSLRTNAVANNWIEFKTPLLVKGRYKVWIAFIRRGGGGGVQVSFNGKPLPKILNLRESLPSPRLVGSHWTYPVGVTPESLEALGKKITFGGRPEPDYAVPYYNNPAQTIDYYQDNYALLAGTIEVEKTDRHMLRLDATWEGSGDVQFDMIHFIPEKENQLWPKFNPDGTIVPKP